MNILGEYKDEMNNTIIELVVLSIVSTCITLIPRGNTHNESQVALAYADMKLNLGKYFI
jgi:hypothetical protein